MDNSIQIISSESDNDANSSLEVINPNELSPTAEKTDTILRTPSSASKRKRDELTDVEDDSEDKLFIEMERQSPEPRRKNPTPLPTPQKLTNDLIDKSGDRDVNAFIDIESRNLELKGPDTSPVKPPNEISNQNIPDVVQEGTIADFDENLPETVTLLHWPGGGKVYVVGTAHFSQESQDDVANVINRVKPDRIVVELCGARTDILLNDEEAILKAAKEINFQKISALIKKHGTVQGLLYITLLTMSAHVTKELGMAPGGEFRRAFREADNLQGCVILLGDRPINITMARLLASLSWWQCAKLVWNLVVSKDSIKKEDVENAKKKDFLEAMLAEMAGEFPSMKKVLVNERDKFLAYSLQNAVTTVTQGKADGPNRVVGVVGIGHAAGIKKHFGRVTEADIARLMYVPPPSMASKVVRTGFRLVLIGGAAYLVYKVVPVQRIVNYMRPTGTLFFN